MKPIEKIKYKNNFLSKVIFRLDFLPILIIDKEISSDFQEAIRVDLPNLEEFNGFEYKTIISLEKKEETIKNVSQWFFSDTAKRFKLTITSSFIALEDFNYTSLHDHTNIIEKVIKAFSASYNNISYTRIGLRFINEIKMIEGNPLKWSDYIADPLVFAIENFISSNNDLSRAMSQFIINKEDCSIVFNFGIFNSIFPQKISRKEFILDYDCHSKDVENTNILQQLKNFNVYILQLFELSIKDSLRSIMGVVDE